MRVAGAGAAVDEPMKSRDHQEEEVVGPRRPYKNAFPRCATADSAVAQRVGRDARDALVDVADVVEVDAIVVGVGQHVLDGKLEGDEIDAKVYHGPVSAKENNVDQVQRRR